MTSLRQRLLEQACRGAALAEQQLYWRMIAAGQLPSQGWGIGRRVVWDTSTVMRIEVYPIPPLSFSNLPQHSMAQRGTL